jgi:nucleoid-associated protein YgaU
VARGDNLWQISQRIYGKGYRYTEIYGANQQQIRNPHLIYPGQVFVLPGEQEQQSN